MQLQHGFYKIDEKKKDKIISYSITRKLVATICHKTGSKSKIFGFGPGQLDHFDLDRFNVKVTMPTMPVLAWLNACMRF